MRVLHIHFHPDTVIVTDGGPPAFARRQKLKGKISTCTALVPVHRSKSYTAGTMCLRSATTAKSITSVRTWFTDQENIRGRSTKKA